MKYNTKKQTYKDIVLKCIPDRGYDIRNAKRFRLFDSHQKIWIPNKYLLNDGTIKQNANLDWLFSKRQVNHKITLAKGQTND